MNFSAAELDKIRAMNQQNAAGNFSPNKNRRDFLRHFLCFLRENWLYFSIAALFLLGMLVGAQLVRHAESQTLELLKIVLGGYLEQRGAQSFFAVASSTFGSLFLSLLTLFFCGFCTISQPISLGVPLFRGLGYGFSVGMFYAQNGVAAIPYVALLLLPTIFFGAVIVVIACRTSLRLSVALFRSSVSGVAQSERSRIQNYCIKYIAFTCICLLISLLDAAILYKFGGLFVL